MNAFEYVCILSECACLYVSESERCICVRCVNAIGRELFVMKLFAIGAAVAFRNRKSVTLESWIIHVYQRVLSM